MRKLLLLQSIALCAGAWPGAYSTFFTITVNPGKVPSTQTNFPLYFAGAPLLKSAGNGGCVQNATGYDVIFASDSAGSTLLNFELVAGTFNPASGVGEWWIRVPGMASGAVIYGACGNTGVTTNQGWPAAGSPAFSSPFVGSWHLSNGTTLSAADSSGNGNNGTSASATAATGQIDGAAAANGSQGILIPRTASLEPTRITVSYWIYSTSTSQGAYTSIINKGAASSSPYNSYDMAFEPGTFSSMVDWFVGYTDYSQVVVRTPAYSLTLNAWHHVAGTYDGSNQVIYLDGVAVGTTPVSKTILYTGSFAGWNLFLMCGATGASPGTVGSGFQGSMDEVHIANTALTADWIKTEYNNQFSPADFYTVSSVAVSTPQIRHRVVGL